MVQFKLIRRKLRGAFQLMLAFCFTITIITSYTNIQYDGIKLLEQQNNRVTRNMTSMATLSIGPFIQNGQTEDLSTIVNDLAKKSFIIDATIYDHLGQPLAQSENVLPLDQVIPLANKSGSEYQNGLLSPYVNSILNADGVRIGYLRVTYLSQTFVGRIEKFIGETRDRLLIIIGMTAAVGFILARRSWKRSDLVRLITLEHLRNYFKAKSLKSFQSSR